MPFAGSAGACVCSVEALAFPPRSSSATRAARRCASECQPRADSAALTSVPSVSASLRCVGWSLPVSDLYSCSAASGDSYSLPANLNLGLASGGSGTEVSASVVEGRGFVTTGVSPSAAATNRPAASRARGSGARVVASSGPSSSTPGSLGVLGGIGRSTTLVSGAAAGADAGACGGAALPTGPGAAGAAGAAVAISVSSQLRGGAHQGTRNRASRALRESERRGQDGERPAVVWHFDLQRHSITLREHRDCRQPTVFATFPPVPNRECGLHDELLG